MANLNDVLSMVNEFEELISTAAKEKKKLDPSAGVRNRGDVVFPAESPNVSDHKDHFELNNIGQARNALARCQQYTKCPPWYKGSLKSLQEAVSRKVHSKYPSIGKDKKKSSALNVDHLLAKYATAPGVQALYNLVVGYEYNLDLIRDFASAMRLSAEDFAKESDMSDPIEKRVYDLLLKEAKIVWNVIPEMEALDQEIEATRNNPMGEQSAEASLQNLLAKYGSVESVTNFLSSYHSTYQLLEDLAKAQFTIAGLNMDEEPSDADQAAYDSSKQIHDIIMECAMKVKPLEESTW